MSEGSGCLHNRIMETQQLKQLSKRLALHLRHEPASLGLTLESGGWVQVDDLLAALNHQGFAVTRAQLEEVVAKNDKQRFSFDPSGGRIRANQGHSVPVDLELQPLEPPAVLFHGTTSAALQSVLQTGLQRMKRHHVHLSPDVETAHRVGSRHGKAVILRVNAGVMSKAGLVFYRSDNGVWLTDHVPGEFLEVALG